MSHGFWQEFEFPICCNHDGIHGDADWDMSTNVAGLTYLVDYLFFIGPPPYPLFIGDVDGDCSVNVTDISYLVEYLFFDGPAPKVGCEPT